MPSSPTSEPLAPAFRLAARLAEARPVFAGWVSLPDPLFAEHVVRTSFEAVVFDMQHGLFGIDAVPALVGAAAAAGCPAIVRAPVEDFASLARALDCGAAGVIAPMINSAADARRLVEFTKFPPRGRRSWGPGRAMALAGIATGPDYFARADGFSVVLAMIETREGLEALDEILAVDGIDGVFVGPNDLCIALTDGGLLDPEAALLDAPLARIVAACERTGKIAGIFGGSGARAGEMARRGFRLVTVGHDAAYVKAGIEAMVGIAKGA